MSASATAWLGTSLPPLAATQVYKLLEAGALKPSFNRKQLCTVQGRFLVCDEATANSPTTLVNMVECPINLYRAALLLRVLLNK